MAPTTRDAKKQAQARQRRHRTAQERLARDRRQAQQAAQALEQAIHDLGLPEDLVAEIEGRLRSQQKLLGKICGVMFPSLFGCRTNTELCRVREWDKNLPSRLLGALLMGCFVLLYTSRVVCKGQLTMEEIIFSLKHYWRFVDSELLELQALSWRADGKAT